MIENQTKKDTSGKDRFKWPVRPAADPANIVCGNTYRFTVLTPQMIRLEYDRMGKFEDRASQAVFYRDFPVCKTEVQSEEGWLTVETEKLVLHYQEEQPFTAETLWIKLKEEPASSWHYGEDFEDLGGTTKTLDMVDGARPLERGLCSRNGFSVLEDSNTLVLGEDGWVELREKDTVDCYFFGYGFDYVTAVSDFYRLTGAPTMLPAYAFGNWWSRYHAYTQQEYLELMDRFKEEGIPFSVSVIDMDWHVTQIPEELWDEDPGYRDGWTGYSWNKELFPDYRQFLQDLKKRNLKITLNLHPHAGVCRHEDMYKEMAEACGVDPESGKRIPIDVLSPSFMGKYFDILHHPYEEDGVDFWWMDWQQGTDYWWIHEPNRDGKRKNELEVLDPLWMLNHLHILDIARDGKRPVFFSRYSGPGSQRYSVGFSGDSFVTWDTLAFQPYFTATASNIGYCWWSHDIGGHQRGWRDDEMFVRWVQLGVFSPINRMHSMNNDFQRKEPWSYGREAEMVSKHYLRLRHQLFPYLYTMNARAHQNLMPLIWSMYYTHPKCSGAYEVPNQYWFGSELVVAPITEKTAYSSRHASTTAWLPAGDWFDFWNGLHYASRRGRKMKIYRTIEDEAVFAKAGAIVPMQLREEKDNQLGGSHIMQVLVFPGVDNEFTMYEDSGDGQDDGKGACVRTHMQLQWGEAPCFQIDAAEGDLSLIPASREWHIALRGFAKDIKVQVYVNGVLTEAETAYEEECNTTMLVLHAEVTAQIEVKITGKQLIHDNSDVLKRCIRILQMSQIRIDEKSYITDIISNRDFWLQKKIYEITGRSEEIQPVTGAIHELLTLTEDEYLGRED